MKDVTERVQHLIDNFSKQEGVNKEQSDALRDAISTSPILARSIDKAIQEGKLREISLLPESASEGLNNSPVAGDNIPT